VNSYPEALLPRQTYPAALSGTEVLDCYFIRETREDVYTLFQSVFHPDDVIKEIIAPPTSKRDVFELSISLYGYYYEGHCGIRSTDSSLNSYWNNEMPDIPVADIEYERVTMFPLFLSAVKLYKKSIDFNGEEFTSSFFHKPVRVNYWHFQLFTKDNNGAVIPRDRNNSRTNQLAKRVLENIVIQAICPKTETKPFRRDDFDRSHGIDPPANQTNPFPGN
jgi:hypothetical protein